MAASTGRRPLETEAACSETGRGRQNREEKYYRKESVSEKTGPKRNSFTLQISTKVKTKKSFLTCGKLNILHQYLLLLVSNDHRIKPCLSVRGCWNTPLEYFQGKKQAGPRTTFLYIPYIEHLRIFPKL